MKIRVVKGSILEVEADVIVNAANSMGYMGGGVAGVIKRAGGKEIEEEAVKKGPTPVGRAVLTTAGSLPFKGIIHAPTMEQPAMPSTPEKIKKATAAALRVAVENGFKSIAVPGMGTGVGGVSHADSANAMIKAISEVQPENLDIIFVDIDERMVEAWKEALEKRGIAYTPGEK